MDRMSLAMMIATLFFRMVVEPAEPAAPTASHPHMATQAMMLAIADGTLALASFVNDRHGVVLIDHSPDPSFGAGGFKRARPKRFCGEELAALVASWQAVMGADHDGVRFGLFGEPSRVSQPAGTADVHVRALDGMGPSSSLHFRPRSRTWPAPAGDHA